MSDLFKPVPKDIFYLGVHAARLTFSTDSTKSLKKYLRRRVGRSRSSKVQPLPDQAVYLGTLAALVAYVPLLDSVQETLACDPKLACSYVVSAVIEQMWPDRIAISSEVYEIVGGVVLSGYQGENAGVELFKATRLFLDSCWTGIGNDLRVLLHASGWLYNSMNGYAAAAESFTLWGFWHPGVKPEGWDAAMRLKSEK